MDWHWKVSEVLAELRMTPQSEPEELSGEPEVGKTSEELV